MNTDKRLQLRRVYDAFNNRDAAKEYVANLTSGQTFNGLYGEPIVAKYKDDGKEHLILALGIESGTPYHIIDTYGLELDIKRLEQTISGITSGSSEGYAELLERIENEEIRAGEAEESLNNKVTAVDSALTQHIADCGGKSSQIKIDENSESYLRLSASGNDINVLEAIVNGKRGYLDTLATTSYVRSGMTTAINVSKSAITAVVDMLQGPVTVDGSIKDTINESLIAAPVDVNIGDVQKISLIKWVDTENGPKYFVTNDASEMTCSISGSTQNLNSYIESLHNRIKYLESVIGTTAEQVGHLPQIIKQVVREYLVGTDYEIKLEPIVEDDISKLRIGFPDNAIFGPDPLAD